ncbi:hypothetical protein [Clostridium hydrogenum]|uniref:hypothetical protein n=1 Tax=Clostridium hydrogenum TaxID=2855764 RepID=UPI001F3EEDF8|nr:hypothetical protein [Clostridium hydrogenum]
MKDEEKKQIMHEAEMQSKLLKNLSKWSRNVMVLSSIGIVLAYYGLSRSGVKFTFGIFGAVFAAVCAIVFFLINLGIRNGKRNVNDMLKLIK